MKLLSFRCLGLKDNNFRYSFTLEFQGKQQDIILKEKFDWPIIQDQDLELVEKWLFKTYSPLCYLAFGVFHW